MDSILYHCFLGTACDEFLHLLEFGVAACLKTARIVKYESWVASKHHFVLYVVQSALKNIT
jgi:hypothetical protein